MELYYIQLITKSLNTLKISANYFFLTLEEAKAVNEERTEKVNKLLKEISELKDLIADQQKKIVRK